MFQSLLDAIAIGLRCSYSRFAFFLEEVKTPQALRIDVGGQRFAAFRLERPSAAMYASIVTTSEFSWDAVYVLPWTSFSDDDARTLAKSLGTYDASFTGPQANVRDEILVPIADGLGLSWFMPRFSSEELRQAIAQARAGDS